MDSEENNVGILLFGIPMSEKEIVLTNRLLFSIKRFHDEKVFLLLRRWYIRDSNTTLKEIDKNLRSPKKDHILTYIKEEIDFEELKERIIDENYLYKYHLNAPLLEIK